MAIGVVLFIFVVHLGSVVHSAFPSKHETVSFETRIERNIEVSNHSAKPNAAETAPMICPVGFGCGYQIYNRTTRKTRRFVEYCTCPEKSSCIKVGDNLMYHLYYYQCKNDLEDVWMPTHSSTTELPDVNFPESSISDMQDCTEDYMNRAHKTPEESTVSPRSNKIVQPSDAYLGNYRIYLFVPQNQEQDVESSDQNNNGFTIPTYITPDNVSDSPLDEIAESSVAYPGSKWESSPLQNSEKYEVKNDDSLFKSSKLLERITDHDVDTDSNIGQNFASIEPSASNLDSKIISSLVQKMDKETETTSFDGSNYSTTEMDYSTSGKHNALNSFINKSSSDGDVKVTYEIGADAGAAVNVPESSLDNPVSDVESTTVEIPLGKIEL